MFKSIILKNFCTLSNVEWKNLADINVVLGVNNTGKTTLLKILYCIVKTIEEFKRNNSDKPINKIFFEKIYWTFQFKKIGDLVKKSQENMLCEINFDDNIFNFEFNKDTKNAIKINFDDLKLREDNSIFISDIDIFFTQRVIYELRQRSYEFGYNEACYDLAKAIWYEKIRPKKISKFSFIIEKLREITEGKIEYNRKDDRWYYCRDKQKFPIAVLSSSIKKFSIFDILLDNGYLNENSIVFIDNIENSLNQKSLKKFIEIISLLSQFGIQFFISTYSFIVIEYIKNFVEKNSLKSSILDLNRI